jgi:hypothetical protein
MPQGSQHGKHQSYYGQKVHEIEEASQEREAGQENR